MWFFVIGLFCLLVVIGYFTTGKPLHFAIGSSVFLVALIFVSVVVVVAWSMASPCTAPFNDHGSEYCQSKLAIQNKTATGFIPYTPTDAAYVKSAGLPTVVGNCDFTSVSQVGTRLSDGNNGQPMPGSGSAIWFADGGSQVDYEQIAGIDTSQVGDRIKLCLVSVPTNCPSGDDRGKIYQATNLRTQQTWTASDSEHSCGGA